MNIKKILILSGFLIGTILSVSAQNLVEKEGIYYLDSKPYSGNYITRYDNGNIKMDVFFKEGKKDSICKIFFENGELNEIRSYANNEMHGTWLMFNEKNIKTSEAGYRNGLKHGKWFIWNENGYLIYELYYNNGQKAGTWKGYNEKGELVNERKYSEN